MKKIFITVIMTILFTGCATQRSNYYIKTVPTPKKSISNIAIIPENWDSYWISSFAYRALITELMDVGFNVIERSNLVSIIEEQSLQQSGLIKGEEEESKSFETRTLDKTSIAKLGEMLGVEKLLLIYVVPSGRQLHMATIRLVDVETAKILSSTTVITPDNGQDVDIIMQQVAVDIVEVINNKETIVRNKLFTETTSSGSQTANAMRKKGENFLNKFKDDK
ncbi:MAG: hypothetical protein H8E60_04020 [Candidatus Marinimicrobia bacterium]|nr:hypothetical protein [Candidatus Neomarinimicrobiota bacterium]